ncbi:MAG: phage portal protein [Mariniphaga sp.]
MSFLSKIGLKVVKQPTVRGYMDEVLKEALRDIGGYSTSGVAVNAETALKLSAVWCAVRLLSEIPASLPKTIISQEKDGSYATLYDDPVNSLLEFPNEYMTGFDFHELMNASLQLRGNAVAVIYRDRKGNPVKLLPVNYSGVQIRMKNGLLYYVINDILFGINQNFFATDIIHYKLFSSDGIIGRSPIRLAKDNIGLALSAENYGGEFFRKGGNHKAVIETQQGFKSYTEYAKWREKYDEEHSGIGSDHGTPVLQPGMSYKQLTMSMEDAQFIATRQFSIADIARWYNIPAHLLHDLSRATFSNIEHQDLQFIKYSLRGLITRQEKEWEFKMFPPERRNQVNVKFDMDGLARGDMAARSAYMTTMVNGGIITPDEGRAVENRPPIPGGDKLRTPQNIVGKQIAPLKESDPNIK